LSFKYDIFYLVRNKNVTYKLNTVYNVIIFLIILASNGPLGLAHQCLEIHNANHS